MNVGVGSRNLQISKRIFRSHGFLDSLSLSCENIKLQVVSKIVLQNRRNSVTLIGSDLIASNVVFVPAVFTLLESQEGDGYNQYQQGRPTAQSDPQQSRAAASTLGRHCRLCDQARLEGLSKEK